MSHLIPAPQPSGGEFLLYQSEDGRTKLDLVLALGFRVKLRSSTGSWQPQTFRLRARSCPSTFNQLGTTSWPRIKTPPKR
jgi:hypothetical protein